VARSLAFPANKWGRSSRAYAALLGVSSLRDSIPAHRSPDLRLREETAGSSSLLSSERQRIGDGGENGWKERCGLRSAAGFLGRPPVRKASGREVNSSSAATNSGLPSGRPVWVEWRSASTSSTASPVRGLARPFPAPHAKSGLGAGPPFPAPHAKPGLPLPCVACKGGHPHLQNKRPPKPPAALPP
jgi:hypothetical protein